MVCAEFSQVLVAQEVLSLASEKVQYELIQTVKDKCDFIFKLDF